MQKTLESLKQLGRIIDQFFEQGFVGVVALIFFGLFIYQSFVLHVRADAMADRVESLERWYQEVLLSEIADTREVIDQNSQVIRENTIYLRMIWSRPPEVESNTFVEGNR